MRRFVSSISIAGLARSMVFFFFFFFLVAVHGGGAWWRCMVPRDVAITLA